MNTLLFLLFRIETILIYYINSNGNFTWWSTLALVRQESEQFFLGKNLGWILWYHGKNDWNMWSFPCGNHTQISLDWWVWKSQPDTMGFSPQKMGDFPVKTSFEPILEYPMATDKPINDVQPPDINDYTELNTFTFILFYIILLQSLRSWGWNEIFQIQIFTFLNSVWTSVVANRMVSYELSGWASEVMNGWC